MRQALATAGAFFVAPLFPALAISLSFFGQLEWESLGSFTFVYPITLVITLLLGTPAFALGLWLNLVRWWSATIAGSLIGVLVLALIAGPLEMLKYQFEAFELFAGSGAVAGFVFWLIWLWGNPKVVE